MQVAVVRMSQIRDCKRMDARFHIALGENLIAVNAIVKTKTREEILKAMKAIGYCAEAFGVVGKIGSSRPCAALYDGTRWGNYNNHELALYCVLSGKHLLATIEEEKRLLREQEKKLDDRMNAFVHFMR